MASSIPGTLAALLNLWETTVPGTQFRDGPNLSGDDGTPTDNIWRLVHIGSDPENGDHVTFNRQNAAIGRQRIVEKFAIPCYLECVSGDEDLTPLRTAAFDLLDTLTAALANNITLGGLVAQGAQVLDDGELIPREVEKGGAVALRFVVKCETRIDQT